MDDRYRKLEQAGARNISIYNEKEAAKGSKGEPLPYIVILIDEVGDLMMSNPDDTEHHLTRLAQMARAVGMHMVVATQRPSVDVLTGLIKANFPGRIAFSVASGVDSRVILDANGAEALLGAGDMLFLSSDASGPKRLQGCFVTDDEVRKMVDYWEAWAQEKREEGKLEEPRRGAPWEKTLTKLELLSETDDLLEDALEAVVLAKQASTAMLQKHLNVGFPRASRIMDLLFELGAIGPPEPGGKMRKVLISSTRKDPMAELAKRHREQEVREAKVRPKPDEFADDDPDDEDDISPGADAESLE
jgi:S-DNA-T family DNA segregation ATPase FtsK/SpoIIIE